MIQCYSSIVTIATTTTTTTPIADATSSAINVAATNNIAELRSYLYDSKTFLINPRKLNLLPTKIQNIGKLKWELVVRWKGTGFDEGGNFE